MSDNILKKLPINKEIKSIEKSIDKLTNCSSDTCKIKKVISKELTDLLFFKLKFKLCDKEKSRYLIPSYFLKKKSKIINETIDRIANILKKTFLKEKKEQAKQIKEKLSLFKDNLIKDYLTWCYNKYYFNQLIDYLIDKNISFYYVLVDLNWLKELNDLYWYEVWNKAIQTMANFLMKSFSKVNWYVFRLYGDEFWIVIVENWDTSQLKETVKKIIEKIESENISLLIGNLEKQIGFAIWYWYLWDYNGIAELISAVESKMKNNKEEKKWFDIRKLPEENEALKKENEWLKKIIEWLRIHADWLSSRNEVLIQENKILQENIDAIKKQLSKKDAKIKELQEELKKYKDNLQ